jgi:di/tricarboxylate transporter
MITYSLKKSGVTRWLARQLINLGGGSERRLIVLYTATTAALSLVMNNLAAGALLLPSAMETCRRTKIKPSKLLIPVAYGSLLGGSATYFATANIITSNLLARANPPQAMLGVFDFFPTGIFILVGGIAFLGLAGTRLLPDHNPPSELMMTRYTSRQLEEYYRLGERLWEVVIMPESELAHKSLIDSRLGETLGLTVVGIWNGQRALYAPPPDQVTQPGDTLLVIGREERVRRLARMGVEIRRETGANHIGAHGVTLVEVLVAPRSRALGHSLRDIEFRTQYDFTVLALCRDARSCRTSVGDFELQMGDSLLMIGPVDKLDHLRASPDFVVMELDTSDQPVQRWEAGLTLGVTAAGIAASLLGAPVHLAMLTAAVLLILTGTLNMEEAYRAINWEAIFLIAGMYAVSLSMVQTGLAGRIGQAVVAVTSPIGPLGLAAGAYLLTGVLTQIMGGQVTGLVTAPIMISAALQLHTNPQAIAIATATGCSAAFFTPIAHPVNIMMIAPANYEFKDFFRIGWRLTVVCFIGLLAGLVLFWGL